MTDVAVPAWEAWCLYPDGRHGHVARDGDGMLIVLGTEWIEMQEAERWPAYVSRTCDVAAKTITAQQTEWDSAPLVSNGILHFCLSVRQQSEKADQP
jgi:hypothetical protein